MLRCDVLLHQCDTRMADRDKVRARTLGADHEATCNSKRYLVKLLRETVREAGGSEEAAAIEATLPPDLRLPPF